MANKVDVFYPRRRNRDGSFDSSCLTRLATMGAGRSERELVELEKVYVCDARFLVDRRGYIPAPSHWSANKTSAPVSSLGKLLG
jgi:hypothetical protein